MTHTVIHEAELAQLVRSPGGAVARDLMTRGRRVQARAKQLCRVDTGRLRSSITLTPVTVDGDFAVHIGTNVEYAIYLEKGTRRMPPHAFLEPALAAAFE